VWGIPWKSPTPFKGLAYTVGGRSLYWGGWSPRLLDEEMATWPATTVADLKGGYFDESSRQIGVDATNDFVFGELHNALRRRLFDNIGAIKDVMPLPSLPPSPLLKPGADPLALLGLSIRPTPHCLMRPTEPRSWNLQADGRDDQMLAHPCVLLRIQFSAISTSIGRYAATALLAPANADTDRSARI
jgi:hypothetical protein